MTEEPPVESKRRRTYASDDLTTKQRLFLAEVRDGKSLAMATTRLRMRDDTLGLWLDRPEFRRRLEIITRSQQVRREQALRHAAAEAAELLAQVVQGKVELDANRQRACLELVKLARRVDDAVVAESEAAEPAVVAPDVGETDIDALAACLRGDQ